ncbi:hypothetical protein [Thalassospira marina]|uniref:Uncharacterized protein n=1 Tax=Thalassospira marina TaxID=2048283 RepID=A0ABM6Q4Q5_9PROT|nr:hypothetical protein [Thalassospira marina]AUG51493.1 hypothetical protein CSC3H3_01295 [Thalassospira marina]
MNDCAPIDVWDIDTFDEELLGDLDTHAILIRKYFQILRRQRLERETSDHTMSHPMNPYAEEFIRVTEHVMLLMERRLIRAWHYTRMTDTEVDVLSRNGVILSTINTLRKRLNAQVAEGLLPQDIVELLFWDSPFQTDEFDGRSDKFWMVSHPISIKDSCVAPLLASWGGESVYFSQQCSHVKELLMSIGRPRVLEVAMPLTYSDQTYSASEAVVATYGRSLGCLCEQRVFDLYSDEPLGPEYLLAVHSEGDEAFVTMACEYPAGYAKAVHSRIDSDD